MQILCRNRSVSIHARNLMCSLSGSLKFRRNTSLPFNLSYDEFRPSKFHEEKVPIIISHGLFGSKQNWRSLAKALTNKLGRSVITYDAINHGTSDHNSAMSYDDMASHLHDLLTDSLGYSKVILIGHSMGGKTVMSTSLLYPDLVDKLIVVDSTPTFRQSKDIESYIEVMESVNISLYRNKQEIDNEISTVIQSKAIRQFLLMNLSKNTDGFLEWRVNISFIKMNMRSIQSFPTYSKVVCFLKPTMFLGGSESDYITENEYPVIRNFFPNAVIKHIPNAGHWVHSDKPAEFLQHVNSFVTENE